MAKIVRDVSVLVWDLSIVSKRISFLTRGLLPGALLMLLSACQGGFEGLGVGKAEAPIPSKLINKMKAKGMTPRSPIMIRIFKDENVLEVWKQKDTKRYALLETYEICKWSGKFGPKKKEGDRQAPEGFYKVNKHQMNPNSSYYLSFNMGFPNAYDRAHGRTGTHLMIHGACSSAGCYSMTDERVQEIYALARESLRGGQKAFQIQAYPFRLTAENMVKHRNDQHYDFWKMLKQGYDHFEITRVPPKVDVCNRSYVFNTISENRYRSRASCPPMGVPQSLALAYTKKQNDYAQRFEKLLAKAEGRKTAELTPLTPEQSLPGISVIKPKPKPVVAAVPVEDSKKPESAEVSTIESKSDDSKPEKTVLPTSEPSAGPVISAAPTPAPKVTSTPAPAPTPVNVQPTSAGQPTVRPTSEETPFDPMAPSGG